jgi:hypothetical protein
MFQCRFLVAASSGVRETPHSAITRRSLDASLKMEGEIRSINQSINQSINSMVPHFVPADVNDSVYNAFNLILLVTRFDPDYEILMTSP